jgi:hypothetical protein
MNALGLSLIVAGLAFLFSGLIFLLPTERKLFKQVESFEESQKELDDRLDQLRNQRVSLRWSRFTGQFGGQAKMDSGLDYAASFSSFSCIA